MPLAYALELGYLIIGRIWASGAKACEEIALFGCKSRSACMSLVATRAPISRNAARARQSALRVQFDAIDGIR